MGCSLRYEWLVGGDIHISEAHPGGIGICSFLGVQDDAEAERLTRELEDYINQHYGGDVEKYIAAES